MLEKQIELIANPQEFTRLYNTVLSLKYGEDFLPIDDDQRDSGNDGYVITEKRMIAGHCFKRIQKQKINEEIFSKMSSDLNKAKRLKDDGSWDIQNWTFLSNYPISEDVARKIVALGKEYSINVTWKGAGYFAETLQEYKHAKDLFPDLQINDLTPKIDRLLSALDPSYKSKPIEQVPRDEVTLKRLVDEKPDGWEYLYFASRLLLGRRRLENLYRDYSIGYARSNGQELDTQEARSSMKSFFTKLTRSTDGMERVFSREQSIRAFGAPGEPGSIEEIDYMTHHILDSYEDMLRWAYDARAYTYPDELNNFIAAATQLADQPVKEIREWIDVVVAKTDRIPLYLADTNPDKGDLNFEFTLTLTISPIALEEFRQEFKKAKKLF
jgi:hypothetical protein